MKKLFLYSLLFACPWLAQASEVKHEAEQKHLAQGLSNQVTPAVPAASATVTASQAASVAISDEERAKLRMEEINRENKTNAEALQKRIADGQVIPVVPGPAEERARAHYESRSWKDIAAASVYPAVYMPLLALGNGMVNNILARNAGLGVERWRSCRASTWDFMSDAAFLVLQLRCAERFFRQIGLNRRPAPVRWGAKLGAHVLVLQPMIYLLQRLGEAIPLGKFGPALRSRTISVTLPLSIASLGLVGMLLMDEYDDMLERRRNRRGRARA